MSKKPALLLFSLALATAATQCIAQGQPDQAARGGAAPGRGGMGGGGFGGGGGMGRGGMGGFGGGGRGPAPSWIEAGYNDHQNMMSQLGIKTLRPGKSGNNQTGPGFDEATANDWMPTMPDALKMKDGTKVTTPEQWTKRRAEILEDFEREVYGRIPANVPKVTWEVTGTSEGNVGGTPTITKTLIGHVDNSGFTNITVNIQASFTVPANAPGPVPVLIQFGGAMGMGGGRGAAPANTNAPEAAWAVGVAGWAVVWVAAWDGRRNGRRCSPAGPGKGMGLRLHQSRQHPGRQRRQCLAPGHHWPDQQGPAPKARGLGRPARLGVGCQQADRLFRGQSRCQGRSKESRHRRRVPLRQGRPGDRGV